jgi:hypothetical protein
MSAAHVVTLSFRGFTDSITIIWPSWQPRPDPYAKTLDSYRANAVGPGYTATGLNDHRGTETVVQAAVPR